ncbi:MAG TPA: TRAP transporter small permease [Deltaproteobacteria bacterium]|nr:TRAP transporter small permease [Deltaproteobacteria bacterium]
MSGAFVGLVYRLSRTMQAIAGLALVFMMALTTCDVILRIFGKPIIGTYEIVAFSGGVVIGFSTPITSFMRGQIFVDFFYHKFPMVTQNILNTCTRLVDIGLFGIISWNLLIMGRDMYRSGEVSLTLQLPFYPIAYGIAFAMFVQCLVLVCDIVKIAKGKYE